MIKEVITTGETIEEATEKALSELGVKDAKVEVIEEPIKKNSDFLARAVPQG